MPKRHWRRRAFFSWLLSAFSIGSYGTRDFPRHQSPVKHVASTAHSSKQHPVASTFPPASSLQQLLAPLRKDFQQVLPVQHPRDFSIIQCAMAVPLQQGLDLSPEVKDGALPWARQSHYSEYITLSLLKSLCLDPVQRLHPDSHSSSYWGMFRVSFQTLVWPCYPLFCRKRTLDTLHPLFPGLE